jgi:hypothetical protein
MKNLIPILSIILALTACNNYKDIDRTYFEISENIRAWGEFNEGSYWVYQNDSTEEVLDTIVFYSNTGKDITVGSLTIMEIDSSIDREVDIIELQSANITSTKSGIIAKDLWGQITIYGNDIIEWVESYSGLEIVPYISLFRINDEGVINEEFDVLLNHYSVESIDDFEVLGKTYSNVAHVTIKRDNSDKSFQYWISKNNWIIKKVFNVNGEVYSLSLKDSFIK